MTHCSVRKNETQAVFQRDFEHFRIKLNGFLSQLNWMKYSVIKQFGQTACSSVSICSKRHHKSLTFVLKYMFCRELLHSFQEKKENRSAEKIRKSACVRRRKTWLACFSAQGHFKHLPYHFSHLFSASWHTSKYKICFYNHMFIYRWWPSMHIWWRSNSKKHDVNLLLLICVQTKSRSENISENDRKFRKRSTGYF